jgi:hypothetical protein
MRNRSSSRGRVRRRWASPAGEADAGGIGEPVGGDPAVIARVIRDGENFASII